MLNSPLLRNALKIGIATFLTAAIAIWCERISYVWYSLMAVVFVVDDNDAQTIQAASARLLGTIAGGLITFLVHTILSGWMGVMVSFLLILPVLRLAGWQSASGVATLVSLMFLMIPGHAELNWDYVVNRSLDTMLGAVVAIAVGLLLWPRNQTARLERIPLETGRQMAAQVGAYQRWIVGAGTRPEPLAPQSDRPIGGDPLGDGETDGCPGGGLPALDRWPSDQARAPGSGPTHESTDGTGDLAAAGTPWPPGPAAAPPVLAPAPAALATPSTPLDSMGEVAGAPARRLAWGPCSCPRG